MSLREIESREWIQLAGRDRTGQNADFCENRNEPSGLQNSGDLLAS